MPFPDRRTASILMTILCFAALLIVAYSARRILVIFIFAILFAYLLDPVVRFLQRHSLCSKDLRKPAIVEVYLAFLLLVILAAHQFLTQYFINYNLQKGWFIGLAPIITANWQASSGNVWTVPVGGGIGRIMKFGAQPVSFIAQFYGNAVHPANAPPWSMRLRITFLFPNLSKEQKKKMLEKELKQLNQEPR